MRILLAAALVAALPMVAQTAAVGTASVVIQPAPVTVAHVDGNFLNFGTIVASGVEQSKTVGFASKTGPDRFKFTKDLNEIISVSVDANCNLTNPNMKVGLSAALTNQVFSNDETNFEGMIFVGGTLTVPAWTRKGTYSGTYNVTVAYL